jgi:glutaminyl-peptide cyclotransferase
MIDYREHKTCTLVTCAIFCFGTVFLPGCKDSAKPVEYSYKIVNTYPHDPNAFTQGLLWQNGFLYEGTGLEGHSSLRKVDLKTGKILQNYNLPARYFGEGITIFNDVIVQLTYKSQIGFVYDKQTFKLLNQFSYPTEGWGLTSNGKQLIASDGTNTLYYLDPKTFKILSHTNVTDNGRPVFLINELEYIRGSIYANIWQSNEIVIISPDSGKVIGRIDLSGLLSSQQREKADVLNGIAYDAENKRLFITGKFWPNLFEINLIPR